MKTETMEPRFETPDALRHDAHTLAEDARALFEVTAGVADEKVNQARQRLKAALESGKRNYARLQERTMQGAKAADQTVRTHPYETAAVAFGLGAIVGCLLARRR